MNVRYRIELSQAEREELTAMLGSGKCAARKLKRAQILLAADGGRRDEEIARTVSVSLSTAYRTKRRFVEGNLERALSEEPRPGAERKLMGKEEALLVATACAKPPAGRKRWTLTLLANAMVKLTDHDSLSGETGRRRLAENDLKPWRRDMWCIPHVDGEYIARLEDVLDLYAERPDPARPLVCFDETPVQLIGEVRQPVSAKPGQRERYDYEYRRNGTVNLFVISDPHRGWRNLKATERRAAVDYAQCMRELVDIHYPEAACIRVVQDNLSIHTAGALYQAFAPAEARRILRRLEFHCTPNHASWLNMVECEISVLQRQCLGRRADDPKKLRNEIAAWQRQRNKAQDRIKWMFTTDKARAKLRRAYPAVVKPLGRRRHRATSNKSQGRCHPRRSSLDRRASHGTPPPRHSPSVSFANSAKPPAPFLKSTGCVAT
ncbi:transposase [Bradyrhizobium sp. SBR1B]|nr:transposase [Bradyrhizobium sp. SBR1B]